MEKQTWENCRFRFGDPSGENGSLTFKMVRSGFEVGNALSDKLEVGNGVPLRPIAL